MSKQIHYFSESEMEAQKKFQGIRDRVLGIFVRPLARLGVSPHIITFVSFACAIAFVFVAISKPYVALALLVLHVVLDGFDGVLARISGKESRTGAFLDVLNDSMGFFIVLGALIFYGFTDPVLGYVYAVVYGLLLSLLLFANSIEASPRFTLRTKYFLYAIYALWVFTSINFVQESVLIFTAVTIPFVLILLVKIVRALQK